jgi:uncharacterized C2H2 Zn-finger protein
MMLEAHNKGKHSGTKSFVCPHCGRAYAWKRSLREHVALAHGAGGKASFACAVEGCTHAASTKTNLAFHVRAKHLRDRPWVCAAAGCGCAAVVKRARQRHRAAVGHC